MFKTILILHLLILSVWSRNPFPDETTHLFETQCLSSHNSYRALHTNTDPLIVDQSVVTYAKSRCNTISQSSGLSAGSTGLQMGVYGENLYWSASSSNTAFNCSVAVEAWYDQIRNYNWADPTFSTNTGDFTQIVWKTTTKIGCAVCGGPDGTWYESYIVCNYQAPGNFMGEFADNVLPLKT